MLLSIVDFFSVRVTTRTLKDDLDKQEDSVHHSFPNNELINHLHLKFSDSKTWQEAW
jgi:hypothetical protein